MKFYSFEVADEQIEEFRNMRRNKDDVGDDHLNEINANSDKEDKEKEPLEKQLEEINKKYAKLNRQIHDKYLKKDFIENDVPIEKCVGEEYDEILTDYVMLFNGHIEIDHDELFERMDNFILENQN